MTIALEHLCRHLRWKSHARSSGDPVLVAESMHRGQVPFSCLRTCQPWGPDEELAVPECCTPDRPCYVPDPIVANGSSPRVS